MCEADFLLARTLVTLAVNQAYSDYTDDLDDMQPLATIPKSSFNAASLGMRQLTPLQLTRLQKAAQLFTMMSQRCPHLNSVVQGELKGAMQVLSTGVVPTSL